MNNLNDLVNRLGGEVNVDWKVGKTDLSYHPPRLELDSDFFRVYVEDYEEYPVVSGFSKKGYEFENFEIIQKSFTDENKLYDYLNGLIEMTTKVEILDISLN